MMMPVPRCTFEGYTRTAEQFAAVGSVGIPIMVQDAPLSGVELSVDLLAKMAHEIEAVKLFKIECPRAAEKIRKLIEHGVKRSKRLLMARKQSRYLRI